MKECRRGCRWVREEEGVVCDGGVSLVREEVEDGGGRGGRLQAEEG